MERLITDVQQISPALLTDLLRAGQHLAQGQVTAITQHTARPFGSVISVLTLTYSSDAPASAPRQLCLKYDPPGSAARDREVHFYRSVAPHVSVPCLVPCYSAVFAPQTGAYHLLLRYIPETTHYQIAREAPASAAESRQMLAVLARWHAAWWDHPRLATDLAPQVDAELLAASAAPHFAAYADFLGARLTPLRHRIYEQVLTRFPARLAARLARGSGLTLVHDDAHVWNFLLPRDPAQHGVYLLDWQQWGVSVGTHDVAYQIALFWDSARRAQLEQALVRHYHAVLQEEGVQNYPWETCWTDYRLFAIRNVLVPLWAWGRGHWAPHRWQQVEQAFQAFADLECAELLV